MTDKDTILVSYKDLPFAKKLAGLTAATPISEEKFSELKGTMPHVVYDNMYMPRMFVQVTGRCNSNCLHCFAAKDNSPLVDELSMEQLTAIMDMAKECGICGVCLTGGEPTVHPHIKEVISGFAERGIVIMQFLTNGYLLDQELLDLFKKYNMSPLMKISFDGVGMHDTMRGVPGAEEKALRAIKLCIDNGFEQLIQMQVNKKTAPVIPESLRMLDKMGATAVRLIKTTAVPRWELNSNGDDFTFNEYYEFCLKLLEEYSHEEHRMLVDVWNMNSYDPKCRGAEYDFPFKRVRMNPDKTKDDLICYAFENTVYVAADGNVYPCIQMQGTLEKLGVTFGNVFEEGLHDILQKDSKYFKAKTHTIEEKINHNEKCRGCDFQRLCNTGCPLIGILFHGDMMDVDDSVCDFFESGVYERCLNLAGYTVRDV